MRASINKDDIGYVPNAFNYRVKLNGKILMNCFTADEELGEAHCYRSDKEGKLITDDSGVEIATEILYGKVEIIIGK